MNARINIFGRMAILALSSFMLALPIYAVVSGKGFVGKGGVAVPAFAGIFIGAVCVIFGCIGIWFSLFAKASTLDDLDEEAAFALGDHPRIPGDALACRYSLGSKAGGIFIDIKSGQIHFQNCHTRRGFLTSTEEWFSCPITDVMRVHYTHVYNVGQCLTIVTNVGGVRIPKCLANYTEVHHALARLVPNNHPGFLMHDPKLQPLIGIAIAGCGILGLLAGWWVLPSQSTDTRLAIHLIGGTTLGIVASLLLTTLADRKLQAGTATPAIRSKRPRSPSGKDAAT